MTAEIQKIGVNINQIAKRVNATGSVYQEDMPDSVKVIAVFIIAAVGGFDIVNFLLQLIFHCGIALFRCHKVAVLGRVGSP